jgi:flagellar biosynthetic protein FliS
MATIAHPDVADYYAAIQIQTASKRRAVCMLHDRCVQFISAAIDKQDERRVLRIKAQNILSQLQMSLIMNDQVSESLFLLYDYCYVLLERGTVEDLTNAGKVLSVLRDTFKYLARRPR